MCFGLSKTLAMGMPDEFCPPHLKEQALDVEFHWVSESGGLMPLTSGARVQATVRPHSHLIGLYGQVTSVSCTG